MFQFKYCFQAHSYSVTPSMWAFIRARLWVWNINRLRRWCVQVCSCSWIMQRDFVPRAANLLLSPHSWSPGRLPCSIGPLLCPESQFSQKPTQRLILTGFMPTRVFWLEQIRQWLHFRLWRSWDGGFTWNVGTAEEVAWGQQTSTWLSSHQDSVPTCQQWHFSFFFLDFLALTVLVTAVSQADTVLISTTN